MQLLLNYLVQTSAESRIRFYYTIIKILLKYKITINDQNNFKVNYINNFNVLPLSHMGKLYCTTCDI